MKLLERQLLNILANYPFYKQVRDYVRDDIFVTDEARLIFSCMKEVYEKYRRTFDWGEIKTLLYERVDQESKKAEFRKFLRQVQASSIGSDLAMDLLVKTRQKAMVRRIIQEDVIPFLDGPEALPLDRIKDRLLSVQMTNRAEEIYNYLDVKSRKHYDQTQACPTGLSRVDSVMYGGLYPGELGELSGAPEDGKTMIAINLCISPLIEGLEVFYITLDETDEVIAKRFDLRILGKKAEDLNLGKERFPSWVNGLKIIDKSGSCTVDQVASVIERYGVPGMLMIDGGDLMLSSSRKTERRHQLGEIYADYLRLSRKFKLPVWVTTQSTARSKDSENKKGTDLSEAKLEKLSVASAVIMISKTEDPTIIKLRFAKLRRPPGPRSILIEVDRAKQMIRDTGGMEDESV